jgi:hypothetical protein
VTPVATTASYKKTLNDALFSIMDISQGGKTALDIAKELKEYSGTDASKINEKITIFLDGSNPLQKENIVNNIVPNASGLSLIQVDTIRVTPAGRNVDAVCALLNMIPTIELSRCVPYLTIEIHTGRSPLTVDDTVQGLSLAKFLGGAFNTSTSPNNKRLMLGLQGKAQAVDELGEYVTGSSGGGFDITISGMELFTSPQTLVNPDPSIDSFRAGPVLDKFRPFMSIERFSAELTPQVGFFAYKSADLDLTLHDRSRMAEVADFIKADLYGTVELMIEYGWSHPDTSGDNVFADLLNSMRCREKYGVVNSSFSMSKSGEVKIKLKLFTRGMSDMQTVRIGENGDAVESLRAVRLLQKAFAAIKARFSQDNSNGIKEIRGIQQLFANSDDIGSSLILTSESQNIVRKFLSNTAKSSSPDIQQFASSLRDLYGPDGKGSRTVDNLNKSIAKTIGKYISSFKKATKKTDPFLFSAKDKLKRFDINIDTDRTNYVSFGKLMATFVGQQLADKSKYDDVQLIFYPFNAKAGACANHNIAEFAIRVDELEKGLLAVGRSRGLQLSLQTFVEYIANNFIDDMANPAYGLSNLYKSQIDSKSGVREQPSQQDKNLDATSLHDHVQARLLKIGSQDGAFKQPQIDFLIETIPATVSVPGISIKTEKLKTIMKIHIFDRCATAYEAVGALILANREEDLRTIGETANNIASEHTAVYNEMINKAKKRDVSKANIKTTPIENDIRTNKAGAKSFAAIDASVTKTPNNVYSMSFDIEKLRTFIRQNIPTIVYGSNNTGVKEASFSTQQNPLLSAVHMLRAGESGPLSPAGLTRANLPLRTIPARVSMTTIGCPLFQYMQQFFIDFNTNTTIDNIYGINKLTHELSPGKFESKIEFVPLDAYGQYESLPNQVGIMLQQLEAIEKHNKTSNAKK